MAEAIRKDQQKENRTQESGLPKEKEGIKAKTSTPGTQTVPVITRTVGKKSKPSSPITQVSKYILRFQLNSVHLIFN